jgi:hypothetical protein
MSDLEVMQRRLKDEMQENIRTFQDQIDSLDRSIRKKEFVEEKIINQNSVKRKLEVHLEKVLIAGKERLVLGTIGLVICRLCGGDIYAMTEDCSALLNFLVIDAPTICWALLPSIVTDMRVYVDATLWKWRGFETKLTGCVHNWSISERCAL